jgi:outer membrane protein assembly factor BamA
MATIDMQQVAFNVARPGSVLEFRVKEQKGFVAPASLDLDTETIAKFRSVEIVGKVVSETLVPEGMYTLEIKPVLITKGPSDINVEVTVAPPGKSPEIQTITFRGKKRGDVCQALAFVLIE